MKDLCEMNRNKEIICLIQQQHKIKREIWIGYINSADYVRGWILFESETFATKKVPLTIDPRSVVHWIFF